MRPTPHIPAADIHPDTPEWRDAHPAVYGRGDHPADVDGIECTGSAAMIEPREDPDDGSCQFVGCTFNERTGEGLCKGLCR